jgi:hypothetical protein
MADNLYEQLDLECHYHTESIVKDILDAKGWEKGPGYYRKEYKSKSLDKYVTSAVNRINNTSETTNITIEHRDVYSYTLILRKNT